MILLLHWIQLTEVFSYTILTQSYIIKKRSLLCYTVFNLTKLTNESMISLMIFKRSKRPSDEVGLSQSNGVTKNSTNLNDK